MNQVHYAVFIIFPTTYYWCHNHFVQGFRSSSVNVTAAAAAIDVVRQVEAKYPALLFKQQLTAYVEKIYGIIRDNLKKDLNSLLSLCIQVPRIFFHSENPCFSLTAFCNLRVATRCWFYILLMEFVLIVSDLLDKIVGLLVFSFSCKCRHFIVRKVGFPGLLELIENPVHLFPLPSNVKQIQWFLHFPLARTSLMFWIALKEKILLAIKNGRTLSFPCSY